MCILSTFIVGAREVITDSTPFVSRSQEHDQRQLKTARLIPTSEFDSGLGVSPEELSLSLRPASRKHGNNRVYESARPGLTLARSKPEADLSRYQTTTEEDDERDYSVDQSSVSASGPYTSRSGGGKAF